MIGPPPVRVAKTTAPPARAVVRSHVTCAGLSARRIYYDQNESDQREEDHREEDHREEDHREEDQPAVLQREEDQREEDQREELSPPEVAAQSSPVQVAPSHCPPDQDDNVEVACHHVAGSQVLPCTSTSPVRSLPAESTRTDPPRAASIDPCPVEFANDWTAAARRVVAVLSVPLRWLAVSSALLRLSVPAPAAIELEFVTAPIPYVNAYFT